MKEIWKDIEGYEGLYQVSNLGKVKGLRKNIILSPSNGEYKKVILCNKGERITKPIHRLVAEAFLDNPYNKSQVNHINGDKLDNRLDNLEWVTQSENTVHAYKMKLNKPFKAIYYVLQYDLQGNFIKKWNCLKEISKNTNFNKPNIMYCCQGKYKQAYGYKWKYELIDSK